MAYLDQLGQLDIQERPIELIVAARDPKCTFSVDGGTVTELPTSPVDLPTGTAPTGLVVI